MITNILVTVYIKTLELSLERFGHMFFDTFNVKDIRVHTSLHLGGDYFRFWSFGMEFVLFRNWDLDGEGSLDEDFEDYAHCLHCGHNWTPEGMSVPELEKMLALWMAQHIAFTLDVETACKFKVEGEEEKWEIRTFRRNPDWVWVDDTIHTPLPAIIAEIKFSSNDDPRA